jgi:hypothetical protein
MVTTIGNTTDKICISDHATPASAVYRWYIPAKVYQGSWPLGAIKGSREVAPNGTATGISALNNDILKTFQDVPLSGITDYQNLQKALAYWAKKDALLYLSITPDGYSSNNIALVAHYADVNATSGAVTLSQFTGKLQNYREGGLVDGLINVTIQMYYVFYQEA